VCKICLMSFTTVMVKLYTASNSVTDSVKEQVLMQVGLKVGERKWIERYRMSLPSLKSYIGNVNYVEEITPLEMINFCIDQTVSLLLLA